MVIKNTQDCRKKIKRHKHTSTFRPDFLQTKCRPNSNLLPLVLLVPLLLLLLPCNTLL
jgi:hypothetical protein